MWLYAAAALWTHGRLAKLRPPSGAAGAVLLGLAVPACGCTALPLARRAAPAARAPFLVAAYAGNPLLVVAAGLVAGWPAAAAVLGLAAGAALLAGMQAHPSPPAPRLRLDDLLLRREARPWADALPYVRAWGAPGFAAGAVVALAAPWAWAAGAAVAALALVMGPPGRELLEEQGPALARAVVAAHVAFALVAGAAVALLAATGRA